MPPGGTNRRVLILGAGATKSHTGGMAPLATEFFSAAARHGIDFDNPHLPFSWYELHELAARYRIVLRSESDRTNIEEVFTFLEIDIGQSGNPRNLGARRQLVRMIREVFDSVTLRLGAATGDYTHLAANLDEQDTVISFNWDVFLDDQLHRGAVLAHYFDDNKVAHPDSHYARFVIELSAIAAITMDGVAPQLHVESPAPQKGAYLKLHGSIDWRFCASAYSLPSPGSV